MAMISSSEALIAFPIGRIDLPHWIETLSDRDYQACSTSHRAAGVFRETGVLGSINVESIGGHLMIQHYLATRTDPDHVVLRSQRTRAYLLHMLPVTIEVIWTMQAEPHDGGSALFRCTVETRMPWALAAIARLGLMPLFIRHHVCEETAAFAQDIARKLGRVAP